MRYQIGAICLVPYVNFRQNDPSVSLFNVREILNLSRINVFVLVSSSKLVSTAALRKVNLKVGNVFA